MKSEIGCVICATAINAENDSAEHIIPHAIGGRRKVKGFICRSCNSRSGDRWDAVLAKQLEWLSSVIGVKRERHPAPDIPVSTINGDSFFLRADGVYIPRKPEAVKTTNGDKFNIAITARSMDEVKRHLRRIQRKHPDANVDEALAGAKMTRRYVDSAFTTKLEFGGPEANASLIKTALAAAFDFGIRIDACELGLRYLRTLAGEPPVNFFLARDLVVERPTNRFFHCVSLHADPANGTALAYIEYFGLWRSIVVLSRAYAGPSVNRTYALDVVEGSAFDLEVDVTISEDETVSILEGANYPLEEWKALYNTIMPAVLARAEGRHRDRLIEEAFREAAATLGLGLGDDIPEEQRASFIRLSSRLVAEKMVEMALAKQHQGGTIREWHNSPGDAAG